MTDQKPNPCNCSTCTKCPFLFGTFFEDRLNRPIYEIVQHTGCLSHPDARAWLMRDVIKELERLYAEETTHSSSYSEGKADGYDRAITLIKDGVEK